MTWLVIIFWALLIDAVIANVLAWSGRQHWWQSHLGWFARHLPLARGWTTFYLLLVLFLGIIMWHQKLLVLPF